MPASIARETARRCSIASPPTMSPPTAPQPNPSAETVSPVVPRGRCSISAHRIPQAHAVRFPPTRLVVPRCPISPHKMEDGLPMLSFAALAQCFEQLEHTSSRKQLTTLLAQLL